MQRTIDKYNRNVTRRREELVTEKGKLRLRKCTRQEGKKWTPRAVQKACFAERSGEPSRSRAAIRMRFRRGKKIAPKQKLRASPNARSSRAKADETKSSNSYVQMLRCAMADLVVQKQHASLLEEASAGRWSHGIVELALDETEQKVSERQRIEVRYQNSRHRTRKICFVPSVVPALVMHFYITLASIAVPEKLLEWLCPMVALEEKSAIA